MGNLNFSEFRKMYSFLAVFKGLTAFLIISFTNRVIDRLLSNLEMLFTNVHPQSTMTQSPFSNYDFSRALPKAKKYDSVKIFQKSRSLVYILKGPSNN